MKFLSAAAKITTRQIAVTETPESLDPNRSYITNRVLLSASALGAFVGGQNVNTSTGFPVPAVPSTPLVLWISTPGELYVVGGQTVYVILEEPER